MSTSSTEDASLVVFVNGEVCPLLEDLRLPLYAYFPDAILMDPSTNPPTEMLLCTSADEYGITQRKLLPNGCYEAYFRGVDGRICPVVKKAGTWAYVMNLPPHTTPKMLGTYFEEFDQVQEANVFRGRHAQCTGRGWVVLHDPSKMDLVPPALEFYNTIITVELSSVEPSQRCLPPLPPPPIGRSSVGLAPRLGMRDAPPPPPPPPSRSRLTTGVAPIGDHLTLNSPNISTSSSSSSSRASYFLFYVNAVELNALHQDRYFRPGIAKLEIMYRAQRMSGAGATYLLFVLRHCPVWTLVGVAKMAATRVPGEDGCSLEWVLAHLHLVESDVRHIAGSNVLFRCKDGAAVRGEVGAELLSMAEQVPCPPTHTNSNGNNNGSASSNHHHTPPPPPPSYRGGRGGGAMTRGRGGMPARGGAARRAPPPPLAIGADLPPPPPRPSGW